VYDLEVNQTHSFIANGVVVHNSNIEKQDLFFTKHSIVPWASRLEQCYNTQLLPENDQLDYFFKHNLSGLLRGDIEGRGKYYSTARQWGWLSANDIRELEDMNPIEEGGDVYLVPMNMTPSNMFLGAGAMEAELSELPEGNIEEDQQLLLGEGDKDDSKFPMNRHRIRGSFYGLFLDAAERFVRLEANAVKRAVEKHLTKRNLLSFEEWMEQFYFDLPDKIKRMFKPVVMSYVDAIQKEAHSEIQLEPEMTPELKKFVDEYLDTYSGRHIKSSLGQLRQMLRESDPAMLAEDVEKRADEWAEKRHGKIATNEGSQIGNAVASMIFLGAGYRLVWRARGKSCPYCRELDGKVVSRGQDFVLQGDFQPKGDLVPMRIRRSVGHPPLHHSCDCGLTPG